MKNTGIFFLIVISATSLLMFIILFNRFHGDSFIYLCYAKNFAIGYGLVLNKGEFSSGATSPLWAIILSICFLFHRPEIIAKIIGVGFLILGIAQGRSTLPKNNMSDIVLMLVFYFCAESSIYFYETGLMVLIMFFVLDKKDWSIGVLPFVRPEGIIFSILYILLSRKWQISFYLLPIAGYWILSWQYTGYFSTSVIFRSIYVMEEGFLNYFYKRYLLILTPVIAYVIGNVYENYINNHRLSLDW